MSRFADYLKDPSQLSENKMDNSASKSCVDDSVEKLVKMVMNVSVPGSDDSNDKKFTKAMDEVCALCEKAMAKLKPWT
jgi:hypothetical protein